MPSYLGLIGGKGPAPSSRALAITALITVFIIIFAMTLSYVPRTRDKYSVGYQIGPHYLGTSTWGGTPYALTPTDGPGDVPCRPQSGYHVSENSARGGKDKFYPFAPPDDGPRGTTDPPALVYTPPLTSDLRGDHPNWWRPDGGSYGLPPAAERPDFWAGDATIHTYRAVDPIPQLCDPAVVAEDRRRLSPAEWTEKWQYYGGPKGWNMSPYY